MCGQYLYSAKPNTPTGCFNSQLIECFNLHFERALSRGFRCGRLGQSTLGMLEDVLRLAQTLIPLWLN